MSFLWQWKNYASSDILWKHNCSFNEGESPSDLSLLKCFLFKFIVTSLSGCFLIQWANSKEHKIIFKIIQLATAISCYVCNSTDTSQPFECSEWFERYDTPDIQPVDCAAVHGAKYCIKHIGRFEGSRKSLLLNLNINN